MNPFIKHLLGFKGTDDDGKVKGEWEKRTKNICKPCWELKYCPYGPLVEEFPLLSISKDEAIEHNEFIKKQLSIGAYSGEKKKEFEKQVEQFDPSEYPEEVDPLEIERACTVFGHLCPVFFVNEPFTETKELRRIGRYISRPVMIRVVRRDNNQCQICSRVLRDDEIEFDHIIPLSKGGSTEENNLRVTCYECNRSKSDGYEP